ncbi:MAG: hypothetical protein RIT27_52 [Pseudomonadota bacterium]|jgi:outer membrane protein assembly factor BamC
MKRLFVLIVIGSAAGCSFLDQHDRRVEYKNAKPASSLELPPDLAATLDDELKIPANKTTYAAYSHQDTAPAPQKTAQVVAPKPSHISVLRDGNQRWLQISGQSPDQLWQKVRNFWVDSGFALKKDEEKTGILETEWNENRGDIPQDVVRRTLGKVLDFLWQGSTRDKFRTRLERVEQGTEIFLTHRGAEEVSQGDSFVWQARASDPELEAEMLQRLMIYLGETPEQAKTQLTAVSSQQPRAGLNDGLLLINEEFALAWRSVGLAIDKSGINIDDRNRTTGLYYVKYVPSDLKHEKKGWLESLWGNREEVPPQDLQIRITELAPTQCQVEILDKNGKPSNLSSQINQQLLKQLK